LKPQSKNGVEESKNFGAQAENLPRGGGSAESPNFERKKKSGLDKKKTLSFRGGKT